MRNAALSAFAKNAGQRLAPCQVLSCLGRTVEALDEPLSTGAQGHIEVMMRASSLLAIAHDGTLQQRRLQSTAS
jgi:hypothetical protein